MMMMMMMMVGLYSAGEENCFNKRILPTAPHVRTQCSHHQPTEPFNYMFPQLLIKHIRKTLVSTHFDKYKTQTQRRCITCLGFPKTSPSGPQLPAINGWKSCDLSPRCWGVHRFLGSFCGWDFCKVPQRFSVPQDPRWFMLRSRMLAYEQWKRAPGGCLGDIGDDILPSYVGLIVNPGKNPYLTTSTMESRRVVFVAHMTWDVLELHLNVDCLRGEVFV